MNNYKHFPRQNKNEIIDGNFHYKLEETTVEKLIAILSEYKSNENYFYKLESETRYGYYGEDNEKVTILYKVTPETDEEYEVRYRKFLASVKTQKKVASKEKLEKEKLLYETLKKKFEKSL